MRNCLEIERSANNFHFMLASPKELPIMRLD